MCIKAFRCAPGNDREYMENVVWVAREAQNFRMRKKGGHVAGIQSGMDYMHAVVGVKYTQDLFLPECNMLNRFV